MSRYIAFDWGAKRTGIAVTDSNVIIATPLKTIETQGLHAEIVRLLNDEPCGGFVVGVPGLMVGGHTDSSDGIHLFRKPIVAASCQKLRLFLFGVPYL